MQMARLGLHQTRDRAVDRMRVVLWAKDIKKKNMLYRRKNRALERVRIQSSRSKVTSLETMDFEHSISVDRAASLYARRLAYMFSKETSGANLEYQRTVFNKFLN